MKLDMGRLNSYFLNGLIVLTFLFLALICSKLLDSRFQHDTACMLFSSHLIEHFHKVPYRDFFDANLPFAYVIYALIGITTGYRDRGIRIEEIVILVSILAATYFAMKSFGKRLAVYAGISFATYYLLAGFMVSLQREFFIAALLSFALCLCFHSRKGDDWKTNLMLGLLCGLCVLIKPHALPVCLLFAAYRISLLPEREYSRKFALRACRVAGQLAVGIAAPILLTVGWMVATHSLSPFLDMALRYFPLYGMLDGNHRTISAIERPAYLFDTSLSTIKTGSLIFPPLLGVLVVAFQPKLSDENRRKFLLLVGLAVFFLIYPALSGQFWPYHYIPFMYVASLLAAFLFLKSDPDINRGAAEGCMARAVLNVLQTGCLLLALHTAMIGFRNYAPTLSPREGRVDKIAGFLKANLKPEDRVQALDWTDSVQHAMLIANAQPATYYYYDVMFYHHLSHPYAHQARARFLRELNQSRPRFIIDIPGPEKPWVSGEDTTREFSELKNFIKKQYKKVNSEEEFAIYQRKTDREIDEIWE